MLKLSPLTKVSRSRAVDWRSRDAPAMWDEWSSQIPHADPSAYSHRARGAVLLKQNLLLSATFSLSCIKPTRPHARSPASSSCHWCISMLSFNNSCLCFLTLLSLFLTAHYFSSAITPIPLWSSWMIIAGGFPGQLF